MKEYRVVFMAVEVEAENEEAARRTAIANIASDPEFYSITVDEMEATA